MAFRTVCGDIQLNQFEGDVYYLTDQDNHDKSLGVGSVVKCGRGRNRIVALQKSESDRLQSGWVVIDCSTKEVIGPFSPEQLAARSDVADIEVVDVLTMWKRLAK
jgi:hypothetical protein